MRTLYSLWRHPRGVLQRYACTNHFLLLFFFLAHNFFFGNRYHLITALKPQQRSVTLDHQNTDNLSLARHTLAKQMVFDYQLSVAVAQRIHPIMSKILQLVPTGVSLLLKLIENLYPSPQSDVITHSWWVKNILQMSSWCPVTRKAVFSSIFNSLLKVDVSSQKSS